MLKKAAQKPRGFQLVPEPPVITEADNKSLKEGLEHPTACRRCVASLLMIGEDMREKKDFCFFAINQLLRFYRCSRRAVDTKKHHEMLTTYTGDPNFIEQIRRHQVFFHSAGFPKSLIPHKEIECEVEGLMSYLRDTAINHVEKTAAKLGLLLDSRLVMRGTVKSRVITKLLVQVRHFLAEFRRKWDYILSSSDIPIDMEDFPVVIRLQILLDNLE
ncbi:MAG: hypothetical protein M1338_04690 [Patescibacteria group bacterium]|nr:hypothetical protein [Patescibacteria group bacterium]